MNLAFRLLPVFFALLLSASAFAVIGESSMDIFAVTTEGEGLAAELNLKIIPGSGKVWSSTMPVVGTSTQNSEQVALKVARSYAENASKYDYLFEINSNASVVEGPSAGSAMGLMLVAALNDKQMPKTVGITGTISESGSIGPVGGIFKKSEEAANIGLELFMIPKGEAKQVVKRDSTVESVSLPEFAFTEWGMKVVEVGTLDEAYEYAFSDINSIDINAEEGNRLPVFVPGEIEYAEELEPLDNFTQEYFEETSLVVAYAKTSLGTTLISDTGVINEFLATLGDVEELMEEGKGMLEKNYLYSSANNIFIARVNAMMVKDVSENPSLLAENSSVFNQKLSELEKRIGDAEDELSGPVPLDYLEWHASAQERLMWAKVALQKIRDDSSLVIVNGEPLGSSMIKKVQDYEYALAWTEIAEAFRGFGEGSEKKVLPNSVFSEDAEDSLVEAENLFTTAPIDAVQDDGVIRRVDGARGAFSRGWNLGSAFDSYSARFLIKGYSEADSITPENLRSSLETRISELSQRIASSGHSVVWANLYLDHAKYYLNASDFYRETGQVSRATEMLASGTRIALLAEGNLEVSNKVHSAFSVFSKSDYVKETAPFGEGGGMSATVKIEPADSPLYMLLMALLYIAMLLVILLLAAAVYNYARHSPEERRGERSQAPTISSLDSLHARAKLLERELSSLKRHFVSGSLSESETERMLGEAKKKFLSSAGLLKRNGKQVSEKSRKTAKPKTGKKAKKSQKGKKR